MSNSCSIKWNICSNCHCLSISNDGRISDNTCFRYHTKISPRIFKIYLPGHLYSFFACNISGSLNLILWPTCAAASNGITVSSHGLLPNMVRGQCIIEPQSYATSRESIQSAGSFLKLISKPNNESSKALKNDVQHELTWISLIVSERYGNCYYHLMIFNVAFHNNAFQKTAKAWRKKAILRNGLYNLRIVLAFFQKYIGGGGG